MIDGFVEQMPMNIRPLPVAGLSRKITVVARDNELNTLPEEFAQATRETLTKQIEAQMGGTGLGAVEV